MLKLQDGIHVCCKPYYRILLAWSMKPFFAKNVSTCKGDKKTNNLIRSSASAPKFPSWQQPKSLSVDHKPTYLFFLIGKLMSTIVNSKIHTYIWAREEWSSSQEIWFSLTNSLATNLLKCSWTTNPLFFLWILWSLRFRVWRTPWWCSMLHHCCVLSLHRQTFSRWRRTLPSNTATMPGSMS